MQWADNDGKEFNMLARAFLILSIICTAIFWGGYCLVKACKKYIGVQKISKRIIGSFLDPHPENDESHARIRYRP